MDIENTKVISKATLENGLNAYLEEHTKTKIKWWEITVQNDAGETIEAYMVENSNFYANGFTINCYLGHNAHEDEVWNEFYTSLEDEWLQVYAKCDHCDKIIEIGGKDAVMFYLTEWNEKNTGDMWYICPECARRDTTVCSRCGSVAIGKRNTEFICKKCQ